MWDKRINNWKEHKTPYTEKTDAAEDAVVFFKSHFSDGIEALRAKATLKGIPLLADFEVLYHKICPARPVEDSRKQNISALVRVLSYQGVKQPRRSPMTALTPRLFMQYFDDRITEHEGDIIKQDQTKRSVASDWRKIKSLFKKKVCNALADNYGWPKGLVDELRKLNSAREGQVCTEDLTAPLDDPKFDNLDGLVKKTWKAVKGWKYKDPNGYTLFLLAIGGGLRFKECIHVRWSDLGDGELSLVKHGGYNLKGRRSRTIKVPQMIIDEITEFEPSDKTGEFSEYCVCHPSPKREVTWERKGFRPYKKTMVVGGNPCTKTERSSSRLSAQRRVNNKLNELGWSEAGITTSGKKLHKLRGWVITQVIENEDIYAAQRHAGHKRIETTIAHYAGHTPKEKEYLGKGLFN
jgi:integrase